MQINRGNNGMGKTRYLFKKIRDTKGIFHAKMGLIKDGNGMDLTEAEDFKKRWQEYTGELYEKGLHDPDNHDGVITHLEPDILECEVKWAFAGASRQSRSGPENVHGGAKKETKARDYKDGVERFRHVTTKGRSLTPTLFNISYLYRKA